MKKATPEASTRRVMKNPYLLKRSVLNSSSLASSKNQGDTPASEQSKSTGEMGIQSQNREGSIKACKKAATRRITKHKYPRIGSEFDPQKHCKQCVAFRQYKTGAHTKRPKKAHDKRCRLNRTTKGLSQIPGPVSLPIGKQSVLPIAEQHDSRKRATTLHYPIFQPWQPTLRPSNQTQTEQIVTTSIVKQDFACNRAKQLVDPSSIRKQIDWRMEEFKSGTNYQWAKNCRYFTPLMLAIDYLLSTFELKRKKSTSITLPGTENFLQALQQYKKIFQPGTIEYSFKAESVGANHAEISPDYEAIVGLSFLYIDWKILAPELELVCPTCWKNSTGKNRVALHHERTNFSQNKSVFPIFDGFGAPKLCISMIYKCPCCSRTVAAHDGELLMSLPAHLRNLYPVEPRFAFGNFHLTKGATDDLQLLMRTYANAEFISRGYYKKLGKQYLRLLEGYLSRNPIRKFVNFETWNLGFLPPSAQSIRKYFIDGEKSSCTPYGYSYEERYCRELQSVCVPPGETLAIDWTFQTVKNFKVKNAKALFTGITGKSKEVVWLALVESTAVKEIAHLVLQAVKSRKIFQPAILYTDTCPDRQTFWKSIFGSTMKHRLGLFHLMHRIFDTLDPRCGIFWKGLVNLKNSLYYYTPEDLEGLKGCLKNGTLARDGKQYSDEEIVEMRHSKRWSERYEKFLRKNIFPENEITINLSNWLSRFKNAKDESDKPLFTAKTEKVVQEQLKKVYHVSDPVGMDLYTKIPAGPKSSHNLPQWRSSRAESALEKTHEWLAHMANTGSAPELATVLTLGGICLRNVDARWRNFVNEKKLSGQPLPLQVRFEATSPFDDHSFLYLLNETYRNKFGEEIIKFVTTPTANNGEVFLCDYFSEQQRRNEQFIEKNQDQLCKCSNCVNLSPPITETGTTAVFNTPRLDEMTNNTNILPENLRCVEIAALPPNRRQIEPFHPASVPTTFMNWRMQNLYGIASDWRHCCYERPPYFCERKLLVRQKLSLGLPLVGRKPKSGHPEHDRNCPKSYMS